MCLPEPLKLTNELRGVCSSPGCLVIGRSLEQDAITQIARAASAISV